MPSLRCLGLPVLAVVLAGCSDSGPPTPPPVTSTEIRNFDFGAAEWFDVTNSVTVKLVGGMSHPEAQMAPTAFGMVNRVLGPVVYTDVDADGDEDAAVGLTAEGGQTFNTAWHIWLWQDGRAVQLRQPIALADRCQGEIESVTAKPGAFSVTAVLRDEGDSCSASGSLPVSYEVSVQDGWPVRIRPEFGPVETCNPREQTEQVVPPGELQLRTWPDEKSPAVGEPIEPTSVFVDEVYVGRYFRTREDRDKQWVLVSAPLGEGRRVCGWARYPDVIPG
ncbi:hypothetical protein [Kibdelosporangium aridum]|uniref:Lipoprotein n=1 Tax=Kibdelosporangium aridum TaxID=2030 RepID=A0A1Y5WRD5_KIBAR|nr:hypothetical protein [Kibdelosporangium aridum]SMC47144.1 hypothetical protein SAMN05661093_00011 [Kibdelosporangium aridum]